MTDLKLIRRDLHTPDRIILGESTIFSPTSATILRLEKFGLVHLITTGHPSIESAHVCAKKDAHLVLFYAADIESRML